MLVKDWEALAIAIGTAFAITIILDYFLFKEQRALQLFRKNLYLGFLVATAYVAFYFIGLKPIGDILVILFAAYMLDKLIILYLKKIIGEIIGNLELQTISIFLSRVIVWSSAFFFILSALGIDLGPILASLGIGSIVIGLALQSTLSNLFSGMAMASEGVIKEGDILEIPDLGIVGQVEDITWRSVHLRTMFDTYVIIPFDYLSKNVVINRTRKWRWYWAKLKFGVSYFEDLDKVKEILRSIIARHGLEGRIYFREFGDSNINLDVLIKVKNIKEELEKLDLLIREIKKEFDRLGIEISFPNRNIFLRAETLDDVLRKIKEYKI